MQAGAAAAVRARHGASVIAEEACRLLHLEDAALLRHLPRAVLGAMAGAARERGIVRDALVQRAHGVPKNNCGRGLDLVPLREVGDVRQVA